MADDFDFAFNLQLEEALTASLLDGAVSSPNADGVPYDAVFGPALSDALQRDDLFKYERELLDQYGTQAAAKRLRLDLCRQVHDRAFACQISNTPEEEWRRTGDYLQKPYGEGSSSSSSSSDGKGLGFRVYVKGLVEGFVGGVAVVIRDDNDGLVFELGKGLSGKDQTVDEEMVELKALIGGLDAAVMLELKGVTFVTDNRLLYLHITGKAQQLRENFAVLSNQIDLLLRKLGNIRVSFVTRDDNGFAVELARKAIASEVNRSAGSSGTKNLTKTCTICLEDTDVDQMLLIAGCLHSYCFSCMSKHAQFKLLHGIIPKCPDENCKSLLELDSCKKFLTAELFDIMCQRVKEASIPPAEKIYCPYARCSTLLSKTELQGSKGGADAVAVLGGRKCPRCGGLFCINCKVPWHSNMSCSDFKRRNPNSCKDEKKLKSLATENLWRQCPKCNHMVSLSTGCYHIYCRCGHEFCYTCGAEWQNKKATCSCPIWDERNIVYDD
ncbi:E3 ubiquitin-protein ligase RSL1-like [Salvia miltiorrhiza]|uniref:E3 ubiquitin-protein ligase RSL1-like n=1 Tax=Salvia miltiorrhiza TaxID=226208 RepID=UPI0025AD064A|nr:E3 ubiquitin-protein ligase RSL1-like [Salvia miltiorrhiza]